MPVVLVARVRVVDFVVVVVVAPLVVLFGAVAVVVDADEDEFLRDGAVVIDALELPLIGAEVLEVCAVIAFKTFSDGLLRYTLRNDPVADADVTALGLSDGGVGASADGLTRPEDGARVAREGVSSAVAAAGCGAGP